MESYSFFDSIMDISGNYDRPTKAIDFDRHFKDLFTNGVFENPSTNLLVTADGSGMTVAVQPGPAWINGKKYDNDAPLPFTIETADAAAARIDRVVIRLDYDNRKIYAAVKKGAYTQTPAAPALQRDADAYELGLADIAVAAGASAIHQADITDLRLSTALCGLVNFCKPWDTTAIYNQMQDWLNLQKTTYAGKESDFDKSMADFYTAAQTMFTRWFDSIKGQLSADMAGNLLNMINSLAGDGRTTETVKQNADNIAANAANIAIMDTKFKRLQLGVIL